jgi:hypothetical protein
MLDVPVKVAVPAEAVKLPYTNRPDVTLKFVFVVIVPVAESTLNVLVPEPDMDLAVPLMVMVPALAVKLPLTDK